MSLRLVDLFSGCGGMSLGFQSAGYNILAAFDKWKPAVDVYRANFKHPIHEMDLSEKNLKNCYKFFNDLKPDIIVGGPPCQDFSHAGKRDESLGRAGLTISYAKIISEVRPRFFVMENVPRIATSEKIKDAIKIFKKSNYGLSCKVLDASLCGVPQKRLRFFLVGELGGQDNALLPYLEKGLSKEPMTVRKYLGNSLGVEHYYRHPRNYSRRAIYSIDEPSPTVRGVNRPTAPNYPGHPADSTSEIKNTRPLTSKERSYVQTFPKNFDFFGNKTDLELMIGNAVPVKLAEYVANCIMQYASDKDRSGAKIAHGKKGAESQKNFYEIIG